MRLAARPPRCPGSRGCSDKSDEPCRYPLYDQVQPAKVEFELGRRAGRVGLRFHVFSGARRGGGGQRIAVAEVLRTYCHACRQAQPRHTLLISVDNAGVVDNYTRPRPVRSLTPRQCRRAPCRNSRNGVPFVAAAASSSVTRTARSRQRRLRTLHERQHHLGLAQDRSALAPQRPPVDGDRSREDKLVAEERGCLLH